LSGIMVNHYCQHPTPCSKTKRAVFCNTARHPI
jgi:hypothetical protein